MHTSTLEEAHMFIVYASNDEVLVTTAELEEQMIREWFEEGGRSLDDYDREVHADAAVAVTASMRLA